MYEAPSEAPGTSRHDHEVGEANTLKLVSRSGMSAPHAESARSSFRLTETVSGLVLHAFAVVASNTTRRAVLLRRMRHDLWLWCIKCPELLLKVLSGHS